MAWIDDRIWCHPKLVSIPDNAFRVYVNSIAYSAGMGLGGHLDQGQQRLVGATPRIRATLIDRGLWDENGDGRSIEIHDWDEHNGKRDERRRKDRERKKAQRASAGTSAGQSAGTSRGASPGTAHVDGSEGSEGKNPPTPLPPPAPTRRTRRTPANQGGRA